MNEFDDDDDDININAPLDLRYVTVGLIMMVFSMPLAVLVNNLVLKYFFGLCFLASPFVMTKRKRDK